MNLSLSSNGLDCGGVKMLARMVWGTYAVNIEVQKAFAPIDPKIKCSRVPVSVRGGGGLKATSQLFGGEL